MAEHQRIGAIDALRGLAILGMIYSATIGWGSGLPNWMFHCQVPPPDFHFDPSIKGISWVDLVFPFFLFSLGAALPFSLGSRLDRGQSMGQVIVTVVKRWIVIAAFALVLGNANRFNYGCDAPVVVKGILRVLLWGGLFLGLVRVKDPHKGLILNVSGAVLILAILLTAKFAFGATLSLHSIDIIIMIMSSMILFGGLTWLLTRGKPGLRVAIWLGCVALKAVRSYVPGAADMLQIPQCINWLFSWGYMQYLCIVLPASLVGDILAARKPTATESVPRMIASFIALAMLPLALWGFFSRNVAALGIAVAVCAATYFALTAKHVDTRTVIGRIGFALLLAGIAFDPLDGGITKDHCNLSYLFASGGLAALTTSFFMWCETVFGKPGAVLPKLGQNPMIAYTITGFIIIPLFNALHLSEPLANLTVGSQFWGLMHGVIYTGLMAVCTVIFTNKKIFWRS